MTAADWEPFAIAVIGVSQMIQAYYVASALRLLARQGDDHSRRLDKLGVGK